MTNNNCPTDVSVDVCGQSRVYSSRMPYQRESSLIPLSQSPSLGGTLVRYYSSLIRAGGNPNHWLTEHAWNGYFRGTGGVAVPAMSYTLHTREMADFYRGATVFGCMTTSNATIDPGNPTNTDIHVYCKLGCGARRPSPEIPVYLWDHWCGTTDDVNVDSDLSVDLSSLGSASVWSPTNDRLKILLEQVVRDAGEAVYGYSTTPYYSPLTERTTLVGRGPSMSNIIKYPQLLSYIDSKVCWSSQRGTIGDLVESLGGVCFANDGFCYTKTTLSSQGDRTYELGCTTTTDILSGEDYERVGITTVGDPNGVIDSYYVDWVGNGMTDIETPNTEHPRICYTNGVDNICLIHPTTVTTKLTIPPNYFESYHHLGYPHDLTIGVDTTQAPMVHTELLTLCGCTTSYQNNVSATAAPWELCRSNTEPQCYSIDTLGDGGGEQCTSGDFNCGTFFGIFNDTESRFLNRHRYNRLCRGCATTDGRKTVGQCISPTDSTCAGVQDDGTCPDGYEVCQSLYGTGIPAGAIDVPGGVKSTLRATIEALGSFAVAQDSNQFYDFLGVTRADVDGPSGINGVNDGQRWIPDVISPSDGAINGGTPEGSGTPGSTWGPIEAVVQTSIYDGINCIGVAPQMGTFSHFATVETPRYLSTNDIYAVPENTAFPEGLTEPAIAAWCAASSTCSTPGDPRFYVCNDINFAFNTLAGDTTGRCVIRRESDAQYEEKDDGGGQIDPGISSTSKYVPHPVPHPPCPIPCAPTMRPSRCPVRRAPHDAPCARGARTWMSN